MRTMSAAIQFTGSAETRKAAVDDHEIVSATIVPASFQCRREALDEIEQSVAARLNVALC